jgi:hypothetical protein
MDEFELGQWVTLQSSDDQKIRGKIMSKTESADGIEYTLAQFPAIADGPPLLYGIDWARTQEELAETDETSKPPRGP